MGKRDAEVEDIAISKPKKHKKHSIAAEDADETVCEATAETYEQKLTVCNAICQPMATEKDCKKVYKLLKKASEKENEMRAERKNTKGKFKPALTCGIKGVQRAFRKGEKGICILAGDISPVEIYCHLPILCEQLTIPYIYVPSRFDVGRSMGLKRQCSVVLVHQNDDFAKNYEAVVEVMQKRFDATAFASMAAV